MLEAALQVTATLTWILLVAIVVLVGTAALAEFAPESEVARRIGEVARTVSARL